MKDWKLEERSLEDKIDYLLQNASKKDLPFHIKFLVESALSTQKDSFIKIIESKRKRLLQEGGYGGVVYVVLDDIKAELEREDR